MLQINYNQDFIDGTSLWPFMNAKQSDEFYSYIHTMPYEKPHFSDAVGIRTQKYKFFRSENEKTKNIHLYDLENDPFENNNIQKNNSEIIQRFEKIIDNIEKARISEDTTELTDDEEAMISEELKKMGYM